MVAYSRKVMYWPFWANALVRKWQNDSHGSALGNFAILRPLWFKICKKFRYKKCNQNCIWRSSGRFGHFGQTHACRKRQNGSYWLAVGNFAILRPLWLWYVKSLLAEVPWEIHLEVIWGIWPLWANALVSKTTKRLSWVSRREFCNSKATLVYDT